MFDVFNRKPVDEFIDFDSMYEVVESLGIRGYQMKHLNVLKQIWKEYVPKSDQANTMQGELLRQVECLRCEAKNNGNHNWDDNFAFFCNFISETLLEFLPKDNRETKVLCDAIEYVKECGEYAYHYNIGEISDDDANPMLFAYTDDDLYDYISDAIAEFCITHSTEIPYEKKDFIYR